eukprot:gene7288-8102_t
MPSSLDQTCDPTKVRAPWGVQTPQPKQDESTTNPAFLSTYDRMFKGWKGSPAKPIRHRTAQHFPASSWRDHTSYEETFRTPARYSRHGIIPASVNRHHKPHPSQLVWPLEPNKSYMIWKPVSDRTLPVRPTESAPPTLLQYDRRRQMNTTYKDFFKGYQSLDLLRNLSTRLATEEGKRDSLPATVSGQRTTTRPGTEGTKTNSRPATFDAGADPSVYTKTFQGEYGRPSTFEKPPDRSWANIRY